MELSGIEPYYPDTPTGCINGEQFAVARASISAVRSAVEAGQAFTSGPGTLWMKYTGSGTWNGDGVTDLANPQNGGGAFVALATDFNGIGIYTPQVRYNSYLSQYVLAYSNFDDIVLMTSSDGLTWGNAQNIVTGGGVPPNGNFYPTLFNTSGGDPETLGQDFSVFYVYPFGDWSNTSLYSVALTASEGSNISLTVQTNGTGSGTVSGTDCSSGSYASGTQIGACTANPGSGSTFAGWDASGSTSCSGPGSCPQFDLTTTNLTATFNSSNISLTVNKAGSGSGTVSGTNCATGSYASGTQIGACTANPGSGSTFAGWSASGSTSCSGTGSCAQFSLTSTTTLTATFNTTSGGGTPTYVQAVAAPGAYTANPSETISVTSTAGDTLTLWAVSGGGLTSFNAPTATGLTFTAQGTSITSGNAQGLWTAPIPSTGSYTIHISANSSSATAFTGIAVETSGTTTSGIVLSSFGTTGGCESCSGSTLTTTSANSMVLTFMWYGAQLTASSPAPFAFTSVNGNDGLGEYRGAGYYLKSSTGLYSPTWNSSTPGGFANLSVALAPSR